MRIQRFALLAQGFQRDTVESESITYCLEKEGRLPTTSGVIITTWPSSQGDGEFYKLFLKLNDPGLFETVSVVETVTRHGLCFFSDRRRERIMTTSRQRPLRHLMTRRMETPG